MYVALGACVAIFVFANVALWFSQLASHVAGVMAVCLIVTLGIPFMVVSYPASVMCLATMAAAWAWRRSGQSQRWFLAWSAGAFGVAATFGVMSAWLYDREDDALRAQYPLVSLRPRFGADHKPARGPLPAHSQAMMFDDAIQIDNAQDDWRLRMLGRLHHETVLWFVDSPGFGVSRISHVFVPSAYNLEPSPTDPPPKQPDRGGMVPWDSDRVRVEKNPESPAGQLLRASVADFARPGGYGYFRDRDHVAGFQGHAISKVPAAPFFSVRRVELLGVVVHPQPVVYVADTLPAMEQLRTAKTRPLDAFEAFGLDALRQGETLFVQDGPPYTRVLGAVRATKQCTACHACERGDLLGAFSYLLARTN